jgi:hypothetical protein
MLPPQEAGSTRLVQFLAALDAQVADAQSVPESYRRQFRGMLLLPFAVMVSHQTTLATAILFEIGSRPQFNPASFAWVGALAGFLLRKHPIGGWLFYILFQLFMGLVATAININWARFAPRHWTNPEFYLLFTLTTMPKVLVLTTLVAACIMLLRTFEWQWLVMLRYLLILYAILGGLKIAVDTIYFSSSVPSEVATLVSTCGCLAYFYISVRVRHVFGSR